MSRPRALYLFCAGGGVSEGRRRAGFEVVAVDIEPLQRCFTGHARLGKAGELPVLRHGGPGTGCLMHPREEHSNS